MRLVVVRIAVMLPDAVVPMDQIGTVYAHFLEPVAAEDAKSISRAPGVGAKTAARVVLELHDKVEKNFFVSSAPAPQKMQGAKSQKTTGHLNDAKDALLVLGYSRTEVANALTGIDPSMDTEDIIRVALAKLMK